MSRATVERIADRIAEVNFLLYETLLDSPVPRRITLALGVGMLALGIAADAGSLSEPFQTIGDISGPASVVPILYGAATEVNSN